MKLTIKVRPHEEDSTLSSSCPVANALRVAVGLERCNLKTASRFSAAAGAIYLTAIGPKGTVICKTPLEVRDWIARWDMTGEGVEFDFEVETSGEKNPSNDKILGW